MAKKPRWAVDLETISEPGRIWVLATFAGTAVGHAYCERDGTRLRLGGISVEETVRRPRAGALVVLRPRWLRRPPDGIAPLRPRDHGIGAAMLAEVIREAGASGVVEIWGCVTARDL